jgi:hypothetical protein
MVTPAKVTHEGREAGLVNKKPESINLRALFFGQDLTKGAV